MFCCHGSYGQSFRVQGQVVNAQSQPVEFMDVYLHNDWQSTMPHTYTDSLGYFTLEAAKGSYVLGLAEFGVQKYSRDIQLTQDVDMGKITIDQTVLLDSILIQAKKKLIERKVDRLVFNVENSVSASGGDALDALRITPSVRIQNDKVTMIGKSAMAIMIDDKMIELSEDDLINYLRTIPADNIKSIEVIGTPPAKYASQGNSGLINIQLKKTKRDSWNALMGSSYLQNTHTSISILGGFNYNKNKWSLQSSVNSGKLRKRMLDMSSFSYPTEMWNKKAPRDIDNEYLNIRMAIDYAINTRWSSGIQYMGVIDNIRINQRSLTNIEYMDSDIVQGQIQSDSDWKSKPSINSLNWHNLYQFDASGTKMSIDLDYFNYESNELRVYKGKETMPFTCGTKFSGFNTNTIGIKNYSLKFDIELPFSWTHLSFGGKIYQTATDNQIKLSNENKETLIYDSLETNFFSLIENNQALYFSGNTKLNDQWQLQAGLRMEVTQTIGKSRESNHLNRDQYVRFFPTVYLIYKLKESGALSLNYSKRINRPNYEELNPFKIFSNPYSYGEGNPFLNPSYSDNIELSYSQNQSWIHTFYVTKTTNGFGQLKIIDVASTSEHYRPMNYYDLFSVGISESYSFNKWNWWNSILTLDSNYSKAKSLVDNAEESKTGFNTTFSTVNNFVLNKSNTILFSLNYWFSFPGISDLYSISSSSSLSVGIKFLLLDKNMTISIQGNDIFSGERVLATGYFNQVKTTNRNYEDSRSFRFSLNYKFGNSLLKTTKRDFGNEAEQNRI
ncbi:TonB-dependent receptor [Myroides sp. NP-2]|uniref:TonB-dependent receptor domain-containing protein n=2 Tax=unclassified Myroides TaxID=2642485 RepID=UPI0015FB07F7|nr:TonB-dependent receptor [Myroides sp. NP-2]